MCVITESKYRLRGDKKTLKPDDYTGRNHPEQENPNGKRIQEGQLGYDVFRRSESPRR